MSSQEMELSRTITPNDFSFNAGYYEGRKSLLKYNLILFLLTWIGFYFFIIYQINYLEKSSFQKINDLEQRMVIYNNYIDNTINYLTDHKNNINKIISSLARNRFDIISPPEVIFI